MKAKLTIMGIVLLGAVISGGFIKVQTAYELFPVEERTIVIAQRVLWPWRDRWDTSWVPPRSIGPSVRIVQAVRMYGLSRLPTKTDGLILDSLEIVGVTQRTNDMANTPAQGMLRFAPQP